MVNTNSDPNKNAANKARNDAQTTQAKNQAKAANAAGRGGRKL